MLNYLSTVFEYLCVAYLCKKYLDKPLRFSLTDIFILITDVFAVILCMDSKITVFLIGQIMIFLVCYSNSKEITTTLYLSMLCFISLFAAQIIASIPVVIINAFIHNELVIGFLGNLLSLAVIIILFRKPAHKIFTQITTTSFTYKVSLTSFYLILASLLIGCQHNIDYLYSNAILFLIIILVIVISNVLLLYYEKVISTKNTHLEYFEKYLPIYENLINDIRANQHEFTNRIQALQILFDSGQINAELSEQLKEYTNAYVKPLHAYPLLTLKSPLLVASLYSQYLDAQANGITVSFDVSCKELVSSTSEIELTDLATILLQNAIEASKPGYNIYVSIGVENDKSIIEVRNIVDETINDSDITNFFKSSYTTKSSSDKSKRRGYGLYYLNKTVTQNKGTILATVVPHKDKHWIIFRITV